MRWNPACAAVLLSVCVFASAQTELAPNDLVTDQGFGRAVAIDGNVLVVGGPGTPRAESSSRVCVYEKRGGTWTLLEVLTHPEGLAENTGDGYGRSVAVSGDVILVGTPEDDPQPTIDQGSVFVYRRAGDRWALEATLHASDGRGGMRFGAACDLAGPLAVIGAPEGGGAAYVFRHDTANGWTEEARLQPARGVIPGVECGRSVATDGTHCVVGQPERRTNGTGRAFVFSSSGGSWVQAAELTASDARVRDVFGWSVDVDGGRVLVGRPAEDGVRSEGAAYVYLHGANGWSERQILRADDGFEQFQVACSVALAGSHAVLGALGAGGDTEVAGMCGAAYVFTWQGGGFQQTEKLLAKTPSDESFFGFAVATNGFCHLVGAPRQALERGAAHVFCGSGATQTQPPCDPTQRPTTLVEPIPYLSSERFGQPAANDAFESMLFVQDGGALRVVLRNDAVGPAGRDACFSSWMRVDVEVGTIADHFVEGLEDRTFLLRPGEEQELFASLRDLQSLEHTGSLRADRLYGVRLHVRCSTDDREPRVLREEDLFVYRWLDVSDDVPHDGLLLMADVLNDGPDGVSRHRPITWVMDEDAWPTLSFEAPQTEWAVEETAVPDGWVVPAGTVMRDLVHDPRFFGVRDGQLEVRAPGEETPCHTFEVRGRGTHRNRVALNLEGLRSQLTRLATLHEPTAIADVVARASRAQITPRETALFDDPGERTAIAQGVEAAFHDRYQDVIDGLELVANGSGDGSNLIQFHWALWPSRMRYGQAFLPDGPVIGVDSQQDIFDLVTHASQYTRAEMYYRLSGVTNQNTLGNVSVFLDTTLEHDMRGTYELGRMDPDGPQDVNLARTQLVNGLAKTAVHELGHTLSLCHSAQSSATGLNEVQRLAVQVPAGSTGLRYHLSFDGHETGPIEVGATAATIQTALRALPPLQSETWSEFSNAGGFQFTPKLAHQVAVNPADGGAFWVEFRGLLSLKNVPTLTWRKANPSDPITVTISVTPIPPGDLPSQASCRRHLDYVDHGGVEMDKTLFHPSAAIAQSDIMHGGIDDLPGELRFREGVSLESLRVALDLGWTPEQIEAAMAAREDWASLAQLIGPWDDANVACPDGDPTPLVLPDEGLLVLRADARTLVHEWRCEARAGEALALELRNVGRKPLPIDDLTLSGGFALRIEAPWVAALQPGEGKRIEVIPPKDAIGALEGRLRIVTPSGVRSVKLHCTCRSRAPRLLLTAPRSNLGSIPRDQARRVEDAFTLRNGGETPLVIERVGIEAQPVGTFALAESVAVPFTLEPGAVRSIATTCQAKRPGLARAQLFVTSNDPHHARVHATVCATAAAESIHWGEDHVAIEVDGDVRRLRSDGAGHFAVTLPPETRYRSLFYDPATGYVAEGRGRTAAADVATHLLTPYFHASTRDDADGDGVPDDVEFALGTSPEHVDTDGDGSDDFVQFVMAHHADGVLEPASEDAPKADVRAANEADWPKVLDRIAQDMQNVHTWKLKLVPMPQVPQAPPVRILQIEGGPPAFDAVREALKEYVQRHAGKITREQALAGRLLNLRVEGLVVDGVSVTVELQVAGANLVLQIPRND